MRGSEVGKRPTLTSSVKTNGGSWPREEEGGPLQGKRRQGCQCVQGGKTKSEREEVSVIGGGELNFGVGRGAADRRHQWYWVHLVLRSSRINAASQKLESCVEDF